MLNREQANYLKELLIEGYSWVYKYPRINETELTVRVFKTEPWYSIDGGMVMCDVSRDNSTKFIDFDL